MPQSDASTFKARVWVNDVATTAYDWAELSYPNEELAQRPNTGVCFSGGGTRSLSATMGQLRALVLPAEQGGLGLGEKIRYISSVSGGSWASTVFTYYQSGAADDLQLLGPITAPGDLIVNQPGAGNWLGYDGPERLGTTATTSLTDVLLEVLGDWIDDYFTFKGWSFFDVEKLYDRVTQAMAALPYDRWWIEAVGRTYFKPFGLHVDFSPFDPQKQQEQSYFTLDSVTEQNIKSNNAALTTEKFHTIRAGRPYLIVNSTLLGPTKIASFPDVEDLRYVRFEYTPLYVGSAFSPQGSKVDYQGQDAKGNPVSETLWAGGGFVEPFAFGGQGPGQPPAPCGGASPSPGDCVTMPRPATRYTLVEASGTSSSAFAGILEQNPLRFLTGGDSIEKLALSLLVTVLQKNNISLNPKKLYWPVTASADNLTTEFNFGDGGLLDNYGLMPLLRRQVSRIVVFINTAAKLSLEPGVFKPPQSLPKNWPNVDKDGKPNIIIDTALAPLFGFPYSHVQDGIDMPNNHVFDQRHFEKVAGGLQAIRMQPNNGSVMVKSQLSVLQNNWWGIKPYEVSILWVYNERVLKWESELTKDAFTDEDKTFTLEQAINDGNPKPSGGEPLTPTGPFPYFPNYLTIDEGGAVSDFDTALVKLTAQQVNLLADLSCWNITQNALEFTDFLLGTAN